MSAGFPLFHLPFVPLKHVFNIMHPGELTIMSLCSEKTRNVLKKVTKKVSIDLLTDAQKLILNVLEMMTLLRPKIESEEAIPGNAIITQVTVSDFVAVGIHRRAEELVNSFSLSIRVECINQKNNYEGTNGLLKIYQSEGIHCLINYSKAVFHSQNTNCSVYGKRNQEFSQNLKTAVEGMAQHTIDRFFVYYQNDIECDDYKFILDNFRPKTSFLLNGHQIESFQHETNFNSEYLLLNPAKWFTIYNLLTTDCEDIVLLRTKLTNDDMKEYLRQWMAGRFPKLTDLAVELCENVRLEDILRGLSDVLQGDINEKNKYKIVRDEGDMIFFKQHGKPTARITIPSVSFERTFVLHIDE